MGRSHRPRPKRLAAKLRDVRLRLGLTQEQLIGILNYKDSVLRPSNISAYETDDREPPSTLLLSYAKAAGIYIDVLVDDDLDLPVRLPCSPKSAGIPHQKSIRIKDRNNTR